MSRKRASTTRWRRQRAATFLAHLNGCPECRNGLVCHANLTHGTGRSLTTHDPLLPTHATAGHVRADVLGGTDDLSNLRPECAQCNYSAGATLGNELRRTAGLNASRRW